MGLRLAVNKAGVLGISWGDYDDGMYFAVSRDGGKSFSAAIQIAHYSRPSSTAYYSRFLDALPLNEYSRRLSGQVKNLSLLKLRSLSGGLGIAMRIDLVGYSDASDLVADADGFFHAFWSQPGMEGQALWTRMVAVSPNATPDTASITLPASDMNDTCAKTGTPPLTFLTNNPRHDPILLHHWKDISSVLGLRLSKLTYDAGTHNVALDVQFINRGKQPLRGSLVMMATDIHSDFGIPQPLGAIRTFRGGATWDVGAAIPALRCVTWQK